MRTRLDKAKRVREGAQRTWLGRGSGRIGVGLGLARSASLALHQAAARRRRARLRASPARALSAPLLPPGSDPRLDGT
jgi:hypothetical protein